MPTAAEWCHRKWGIPAEAYRTCMDSYLRNETELGWYLCLAQERIIGGLGVIENDFHSRVSDHIGFYERYGWEFLCLVRCDGESDLSRMYVHR